MRISIMKILLAIVQSSLILVSVSSESIYEDNASEYEGAQLFKIERSPFVTNMLKEKNLDLWRSNSTFHDVLVEKDKVEEVKLLLYSQEIIYTVMDTNLATTIRNNNVPLNETTMRRLKNIMIPTFRHYQTVEAIHAYLDHLASKYPEIATVGIMGYSSQKKPLKYIKISSGKENAKVFVIDAGIHAREWVAPAAATFIIKQLVVNRKKLPKALLSLDFYVLPTFNPDGYEYSYLKKRLWRKNRSKNDCGFGADINRNFDVGFGGKGTNSNPCSDIYPGKSPHSEPETQAFMKFINDLKNNLSAYVTFHSYGQYILIPFGYDLNSLAPDYDEMERVGTIAASAIKKLDGKTYQVGNTAMLLYPAAGGSDDWVKTATKAKYVYTIELRDEGEHGFILPEEYILPTVREAFTAIKVIATAAYRNE
ncbi:unnamed protein product [Nezara viridula]|uniref:Peptidase M14 domain-containing protein n=1 Tax=Nezara viridula TaxID=85310 RepID=A0A9P0HJ23_NEZVI|nr:unnamed protein product [Nezara viridula]